MFNAIPRKLATELIVNIWNRQTAKRKKNLWSQCPDTPTNAAASGPWIQMWPSAPISQLCRASLFSESWFILLQHRGNTGWSKEHAELHNGTYLSVWHSCRPSHQWWHPWPGRSLPPPAHRQLSEGGCFHRAPPETRTQRNATSDPPETRQGGLVERCWVCSPL